MNANIPASAETLNILDHLNRDRQPSKYAPGAMALRLTLCCPACATDSGQFPLNETITCTYCGLHMHAETIALRIWRDEPLAAEARAS